MVFAIDMEDHERQLSLTIIVGDLRNGRLPEVLLEIGLHALAKLCAVLEGVGAAGALRMGVDVDGNDVVEINHGNSSSSGCRVNLASCFSV